MKKFEYKKRQKLHLQKLKKILKISWKNGWFCYKNNKVIQKVASKNYNERPLKIDLTLIVIHNISLPPNNFENKWVEKFFQNKLLPKNNVYKKRALIKKYPYFETIAEQEVSSHFYIRRSGKIIQFVSIKKRSWHAGKSIFLNTENCNNFSVGIEVSGSDFLPFSFWQYYSLKNLMITLKRHFPSIQYISGHSDIAPQRKTDPGKYFRWENLNAVLAKMDIKKA